MPLDPAHARQLLGEFNFQKLFTHELGQEHYSARLNMQVDCALYPLAAIAEKRGFQALVCEAQPGKFIPDHAIRRKFDHQVTKSAHEHLIIFADANHTTQVWQWAKREAGKPSASREQTYHASQAGDALIQKLQALVVALEEEDAT